MKSSLNMTRRNFLKAMGVTIGAAALPLSPQYAALPKTITVDESIVDLPITQDAPLAWIEINGVRYRASSIAIEQMPDLVPSYYVGEMLPHPIARSTLLHVDFYSEVPFVENQVSIRVIPFGGVCRVIGIGRMYELNLTSHRGEMICDASFVLDDYEWVN